MDHIRFHKYHGTGNDFVIIQCERIESWMDESWISGICDRHHGVGADGLILILPSEFADFKMKYYNADGKEGSMCGNGGRCASAFAWKQKMTGKSMRFEAFDGLHESEILNHWRQITHVKIQLADVEGWQLTPNAILINTGSPHYVKQISDLDDIDVVAEGRKIRFDPSISTEGVNVNFFKMHNGKIELRTYERGVETETLSCGTGVTAAAMAASLWYGGNNFDINMPGGKLRVEFISEKNRFSNVWLEGPAQYVFEGLINTDFRW
jgi:diaminopimelate epimerase